MFKNPKIDTINENVWDLKFRISQIEASLVYVMAALESLHGKRLEDVIDIEQFDKKKEEYGLRLCKCCVDGIKKNQKLDG